MLQNFRFFSSTFLESYIRISETVSLFQIDLHLETAQVRVHRAPRRTDRLRPTAEKAAPDTSPRCGRYPASALRALPFSENRLSLKAGLLVPNGTILGEKWYHFEVKHQEFGEK